MKKKANRLIRKNAGITPVGACPPKANVIEKLDASSGAKKHGRAGTGVNFSKKAQKRIEGCLTHGHKPKYVIYVFPPRERKGPTRERKGPIRKEV